MNNLRKYWTPWTAADRFSSGEEFQQWLQKRLKRFDDLRILSLILAAGCLLAGYIFDMRPVMLLTIVPLTATLLLTAAMGKTEAAMKP